MKLIHTAAELKSGHRPVCLAIGFFDGVHLGHQQIIRRTIADAQQHDAIPLIITFDLHPNAVVAPDRCPPLVYSLSRKLRTIEALGPEALLLIHFDRDFSRQTGEQFIRSLASALGSIHSICVGANFVFGHKRSGNVALLQQLGRELGFSVHALAAVALNGRTVSSTRVREAVQAGNLDLAGQMLGRTYSVDGRVLQGDQVGRRLGFPTANLDVAGLVLPPKGVYAARAILGDRNYVSILNIGTRPTLQTEDRSIRFEVHLLDFDGDLYGRELEVLFVEKVRDEKKFDSLAELKAQIERDIQRARALGTAAP